MKDADMLNNELKEQYATAGAEAALRYNEGKPKWSLVHFGSLVPMIRVLEFGAHKYAPFNWQKPMDTREILESMQRHLAALIDGELYDEESGESHMGHIQANAMFYNYHKKREKDER
ncbi:MAG: dATP/dGTP diphosphohydrolase domain-containing protein [Candidatus Saccharimonadaceae bacterium]